MHAIRRLRTYRQMLCAVARVEMQKPPNLRAGSSSGFK